MNLKNFQQSELKRFDDKISEEFTSMEVEDGIRAYRKVKRFLLSSIEKAFALGKEEEAKRWINQSNNKHDEKIRSEVRKEILLEIHKATKGKYGYDLSEAVYDKFFEMMCKLAKEGESYNDVVKNLLKNK